MLTCICNRTVFCIYGVNCIHVILGNELCKYLIIFTCRTYVLIYCSSQIDSCYCTVGLGLSNVDCRMDVLLDTVVVG